MNFFLLALNTFLIGYIVRDYIFKVFPYRSKFKKHMILMEKIPSDLEFWNIKSFCPSFIEILEVGKRDYLVKSVGENAWHHSEYELSKKEVNESYMIAPVSELSRIIEEEE